jgi:hypothetical protein
VGTPGTLHTPGRPGFHWLFVQFRPSSGTSGTPGTLSVRSRRRLDLNRPVAGQNGKVHAVTVTIPEDRGDISVTPPRLRKHLWQTAKKLSNLARAFKGIATLREVKAIHLRKPDPFALIGMLSVLVLAVLTVARQFGDSAKILWPFWVFVGVGTIIGFALWVIPRENYHSIFAKVFGWLPVLLGAISCPYWYWYDVFSPPSVPSSSYFETVAQVLPVLLLAVVIDVRRTRTLRSSQLTLPIIAFLIGEINALDAIAFGVGDGDGAGLAFTIVSASLVSTIAALILAVLADMTMPDRGLPRAPQGSTQNLNSVTSETLKSENQQPMQERQQDGPESELQNG